MAISHPFLKVTPVRAKLWKTIATDDDFMEYIAELANIYSIRKQKEEIQKTGKQQESRDEIILFKDFKKWREKNG